jgi:phosphopantothenoylcysteine synthetase/decarboxylase
MKILVTAGNTQAPIDRVRCITNIFTGRTGAAIALCAQERGHEVTLLTSHPETIKDLRPQHSLSPHWSVESYRTFGDLRDRMADYMRAGGFDAVIHCAAVSDYLAAGIYSPAPHTHFRPDGRWESTTTGLPALEDRGAGKVKSEEPELWLRLVRAPKLVDSIRTAWGFRGILVKFKLEVEVSHDRLVELAESSRRQSSADLMVANTLEGADSWAFLGSLQGRYERIERRLLAPRLLEEMERLQKEGRDG